MSAKLAPLLVDFCHWTVGVGLPLAAAVNVAVPPTELVCETGSVVVVGPNVTVIVAADVGVDPSELVNTARYCTASSAAVIVGVV
jgi:hypothetical protein